MATPRRTLLLAGLVATTLAVVRASGPTFWVVATPAELLKGTSDGVLIDRNGTLSAGPRLTNLLTTAPAQIWSLAMGAGGTLWAGTGGDGRVIRVQPGQREETIFDADETNVFAIAVSGTRVYAATGPDGKVYAIDPGMPARVFFDPSEKYIWALATDANGRLWVGAGNPAVIYRVDASGAATVVYRPPASHVVCLIQDAQGRMLAGTESPGRVYRFDATDRPFVLLDSGLTEVRAITLGDSGTVYAAALSRGDDAPAGSESSSVAAASVTTASATAAATPSASPGASSGSRRSTIFRIDATGSWESIWDSPDLVYDVAAQPDGNVLVSTGPEGRLYTVQSDREVFLHTGVDAKQITRLVTVAGRATSFIATANPGRIISLGPADQSPASYVSPVRDTKSASTWGAIRWEATGPVVLYTRSGNTDKPDDSWSDWAGPYTHKGGDVIQSPAGRFLQWKAVLSSVAGTPPPHLTSVTAAYLTRNARPTVTSITVHPPGVVFQRSFSGDDGAVAGLDDATADARRPPGGDGSAQSPPLGRRMVQKGLQTLAWKSDDADGDRLSYTLQYRREGDSTWRNLKSGLTDTIFVWDTTTVGDGRYTIRVVASDEVANTPDRALAGERESDPITIDNTPPEITSEVARAAGGARLVVHVHDAQSAIQKVEYSLAGGPWRLVYPVDGLADSQDERYEIPLTTESDAGRLVVRATDVMQNVASSGGK